MLSVGNKAWWGPFPFGWKRARTWLFALLWKWEGQFSIHQLQTALPQEHGSLASFGHSWHFCQSRKLRHCAPTGSSDAKLSEQCEGRASPAVPGAEPSRALAEPRAASAPAEPGSRHPPLGEKLVPNDVLSLLQGHGPSTLQLLPGTSQSRLDLT